MGTKMVAVATENMGEHAVRDLRVAAIETFRLAKVEGWNDNEIHKHLQEAWDAKAGNTESHRFVDSRGRSWSNAAYLQMLTRTTLAKIDRNAQVNTLVGNGYDLARISDDGGGDVCDACERWSGKVVSLTGATKGLPTLADAEADGLFHPNCVHRLEYLDADEIEAALKDSGQADAAHKAAEEEAAEAEEAAEKAKAESEKQERETLASSILGKMPDVFPAGRGDVFNGTPMYVLRKFVQSVGHFAKARGGAYCDTTTGIVHIAKDPNSWSGSRDTVHHECGHAVLGRAGLSTWSRYTPIPDKFKPIFEAAKRETKNAAVEKFGKMWESSARGLDYADVAEKFLGIPRSDFSSMTKPQMHEVAALSDLMNAATMGNQFFGHGKLYYMKGGECSALHEVVAEATGLISGKYADKARAMFPDTIRLAEEIVYDHKPQS